MKSTAIAGLLSAILSLITMLIGHMGKHDLSWMANHISTFAANAPNDAWITFSMLMSCFSLLCIGVLISKYKILGFIIICMGPTSFFLMSTSWPKLIGISGHFAGLKQRASLLCIWMAMIFLLLLAFNIYMAAEVKRK